MHNSYKTLVGGKDTTFTHLGSKFIPMFNEVTSVIAIPFTDDGQLVAVNLRKRGWDLPGGHVEDYEKDPIETLNREVMEEAYISVKEPVLIEVIESDFFDDRKTYMLVYSVRVNEMLNFTATDEVSERQIMSVDMFIENYHAGSKELMQRMIVNASSTL